MGVFSFLDEVLRTLSLFTFDNLSSLIDTFSSVFSFYNSGIGVLEFTIHLTVYLDDNLV